MAARVLPHSLEAEAGVLGGILLRNEVLAELPELEPMDFYDHKHKVVFEAMRNLEARATPIDVTTLEVQIPHDKQAAIGGVTFLYELTLRVPTLDNVRIYADIVRSFHRARQVMVTAGEIAERGYEPDLDVAEYIAESERAILRVAHQETAWKPRSMADIAKSRIKALDALAQRRAAGQITPTGIPTGVERLDGHLGGLPFKVVSVIAARPKMGKSSLALSVADAATAAGYGAQVFSLEDGEDVYGDRGLARLSGVPAEKMRNGDLQRGDLDPIVRAVAELRRRENWRVDERVLTAQEICRELRRAKAQIPNFALGIVDYLQIVRRNQRLNEDQALREILGELTACAKDLGIALLVLSQLNRDLEKREDKRPTLADLRGSGAIEEMARVIIFLYRGSVYYDSPKKGIDYECNCPASFCRCLADPEDFQRTVQLIIAANNQGQTGRVFARWSGPTMTVS